MAMHTGSMATPIEIDPAMYDEFARLDFCMFLQQMFPLVHGGNLIDWNWHLDAMAFCLSQVEAGETLRLLVNLPPRNLKSFAISVAWVAWMLGRDPTLNFVCVSYSNELSAKLARDCMAIMMSDRYKRIFPKTVISKRRSANYDFNTTRGGGRLATSITGTLTGRGGDYIIIDDPLKPDDANSDTVREQVNDWFRSTLTSRLNDKRTGAIICVMQRLHQYDLSGLMIEDGGWTHLKLPAIATEDGSFPLTRNRVYHRKEGEVLHESREPLEVLQQIQREQGPQIYVSQYQQDPVPAEGNIIKADWFVYQESPFPAHGEVIQSWDTAVKTGAKNDYSVCVTLRLSGKYIYVLDVSRRRLEFYELLEAAKGHALEYRTQTLLIEDAASGSSLIQMLREDPAPGLVLPIPRKVHQDKKSRVQGISSMIHQGRLIFPTAAPWLTDFKAELLAFPSGRFDDQVDALTQALEYIALRGPTPTSGSVGPLYVESSDDDDVRPTIRYNPTDDPWA